MTTIFSIDDAWVVIEPGIPFTDGRGVSHPSNWLENATDDEIGEAGGYKVPEPDPPPEGQREQSRTLVQHEGNEFPHWDVTYADIVVPPPPAPTVPPEVLRYQFAGQAAAEGIISDDAGLAWAGSGVIPPVLLAAAGEVLKDDPERLKRVKYFLASSVTIPRRHELTPLIGLVLKKDDAALDAFYIEASRR